MESKPIKEMTVLITGCSRHSDEVIRCLKENEDGIKVRIISVNSSETEILRKGADAAYIVPRFEDPKYITELIDICINEKVDVIIPYITAELQLMADQKMTIEKLIGTKVSVSSGESIGILNSKFEIYRHFNSYMPEQYTVRGGDVGSLIFALERLDYPGKICCKISGKAGGTGFAILDDEKAMDVGLFNKRGVPHYISLENLIRIVREHDGEIILQKLIEGYDYSMCVLADHGRIVEAAGYRAYTMEYGATMTGETLWDPEAFKIVEDVARKTELDGNACFDFIQSSSGKTFMLECNPRINASMGLLKAHGVNMVYHRCLQLMGMPEMVWRRDNQDDRKHIRMRKHYESEYSTE